MATIIEAQSSSESHHELMAIVAALRDFYGTALAANLRAEIIQAQAAAYLDNQKTHAQSYVGGVKTTPRPVATVRPNDPGDKVEPARVLLSEDLTPDLGLTFTCDDGTPASVIVAQSPALHGTPRGIAIDSYGYLYVIEADPPRVAKYDSAGTLVRSWGTESGPAPGQLNAPTGISVDPHGYVYVADSGNARVQKFNNRGDFTALWLGGPSRKTGTPGGFRGLHGIATDNGRIKINGTQNSDWVITTSDGESRITITDKSGNLVHQFPIVTPDAMTPSGRLGAIAIPSLGANVIVVSDDVNLMVFDTITGLCSRQFGGLGTGNGKFQKATGIAIDSTGNVYVSDRVLNRVQKFSPYPEYAYMAQVGTLGSGDGQFNEPWGMACDAAGALCVVDSQNHRVQQFTAALVFIQSFPMTYA